VKAAPIMTTTTAGFDVAVVGGGLLGSVTALKLAEAGMCAVMIEHGSLCCGASGVNAGTISLQFVEPEAVPYARQGRELWQRTGEWLGRDLGFVPKGVLTLAFTDAEAELLAAQTVERKAAGSPNEIVTLERAREIEPALSERPVMVSYCPLDGMIPANLAGLALGNALRRVGVEVREETPVTGIERSGSGYIIDVDGGPVAAKRIVLAGGAWLVPMVRWLGFDLPLGCYVNQLIVTERMAPFLGSTIGVARRRLTCKQAANGSVLIGGGWQGEGDPQHGPVRLIPQNLRGNIRLACHCVPALAGARAIRTWLGLQDKSPDGLPVIGPLPGIENAFIIGCGHSGFTMGPYVGGLLADMILGREPEMPLFDPARLLRSVPPGTE
jgi:glycine/D-amino acid oxidase-like deaminating enzyme